MANPTCPDCKGKGEIELFRTTQKCDCAAPSLLITDPWEQIKISLQLRRILTGSPIKHPFDSYVIGQCPCHDRGQNYQIAEPSSNCCYGPNTVLGRFNCEPPIQFGLTGKLTVLLAHNNFVFDYNACTQYKLSSPLIIEVESGVVIKDRYGGWYGNIMEVDRYLRGEKP